MGLKDEYFSSFIHNISNEWFIYFKDFDLEYSKILIKRIKWLWNSDINNKLKNQFLEIIDNAFWREGYKHDRYRKTENFIKSHFWKLLNKYIWKIFNDFSLDLFGKLWYLLWYWDIITLISDILSIEYIEEIVKKSWKEFYDVSIFENIEWWTRKDKKKLLEEFKKYKEFNKRLEKRKEILEKNKLEQEKRINKEKEKFFSWINKIIDEEKKDSKWINEYLLYHFDENTYKLQENKEIKKIVRNQVKRFFKLEYSDPEKYELHYTKRDENSSSYRSHQFVVNHTFLRCLKFYQQFWFKIKGDIKKKAIRYVPFAYEDDLENIFSIVWNTELWKDDIDYLLSVYDWTRSKDDLKYHNISSFTWFYEKYKDSFIKYWKIETQNTFIKIINDENHKSYERKYIAEKLSEIWEETQLFELFNNYKSEENYFSNIEKLTLAVIFWKSVVKRFPNSKGKTEIVNWFIKQLREAKISIPEIDYWEWMRWISWIESELSWDLNNEDSFISVFKYINDLSFENYIKELLNYSFEIIEKSKKDYRIYWNYLQQAVFNFYEGIEKKNLKKIFELEKEISENVKDDETRILFKVNFLDKLISIYSENVGKLEVNRIYKSVYKIDKDNSKENEKLKEELAFLKKEKEKLESRLKLEKEKKEKLENELHKYKSEEKDDSIILFVEWKTDKRYLEAAYKTIYKTDFPYWIVVLFWKDALRSYLIDAELLKYTYPNTSTFIWLFDFDSAYWAYNWISTKWEDSEFEKLSSYKKSNRNGIFRSAFLLPTINLHSDIKKNIFKNWNELKWNFWDKSEFEIEHLFYWINSEINLCFWYKDVVWWGKVIAIKGEKVKFCNFILWDKPRELKILDKLFDNFKPIFEKITEIIEDSKKSQKS